MACRKVKDRNQKSSQLLFYFWRTWRGTGHRVPLLSCGLSRTQLIDKQRGVISRIPNKALAARQGCLTFFAPCLPSVSGNTQAADSTARSLVSITSFAFIKGC